MKWMLSVLAVLFPVAAFAADFSMAEANLSSTYGVAFDHATADGQRQATGMGKAQMVRFIGPADEYLTAEAAVDLRPANLAASRKFMVDVARWMVPDKGWGDAERFIERGLARLKTAEKASAKIGGRSLTLERSSDVMAKLTVGGGK